MCVKMEGAGAAVRLGASGTFIRVDVEGARTGGEAAAVGDAAFDIDFTGAMLE